MELTFERGFEIYTKSGFPLIAVDTVEVDRATESLINLTAKLNEGLPDTQAEEWLKTSGYRTMIWDSVNGWHSVEGKKVEGTNDPAAALMHLLHDDTKAGIYIMQNFHLQWQDTYTLPTLIQLVRDVAKKGKVSHKHLFFVSRNVEIPPEISDLAVVLDFNLPDKDGLEEYINEYVGHLGLRDISDEDIRGAAEASVGMTTNEVESALSVALVTSRGKTIDRRIIFDEKAKAVKKSGLLEYIPTDETMENVGGLENLKDWTGKVSLAFKNPEKARDYKLPIPKGCLITGVSGGGKSLVAKAIANKFDVPLFRCDIGRVFGSLVGETEGKTRDLFKLIEALSPAVFLFDELEKSMSGGESSGKTDGGVTSRLLGNFLTFMQEKTTPSYIVGTANDVSKLPPEMLRAGRWDELWFVDLPTKEDREVILKIHIRKTGRDISNFKKLDTLAEMSEGFTGAEIENAVKISMFNAFSEDREYTSKDLKQAIEGTVPLSKTKAKEMNALRDWAKDKAKPACKPEREDTPKSKASEKKGRHILLDAE